MNALDHFSIPVSGLRDGLHEYEFTVGADFFEQFENSPVREASVAVHFSFDKQPDFYAMTFDFEGTVRTTCDRCLEEFDLPIADSQSLLVKFDEKEWEDTEIIYVPKGTQQINVARYIYEFVNLAVPMVKTHDDAGEPCNPDMLKLIKQQGEDEEENLPAPDNPAWDALRGFNQDN